ncbi:MAG: hypothetical protein ACRDH9_13075 [Actinomycetota bacterium]
MAQLIVMTVTAATLVSAAPPARAGLLAGPSPVEYTSVADDWSPRSAFADVNGDGVSDPIMATGDRWSMYWAWIPPGNPAAGVHTQRYSWFTHPSGVRAVNGATGEQLWTRTWTPFDLVRNRKNWAFVDDVRAGELDQAPGVDVLVARMTATAGGLLDPTWYLTMLDGRSGEVKWETKLLIEEMKIRIGLYPFQRFELVTVGGRPYVVLSQYLCCKDGDADATVSRITVLDVADPQGPAKVAEITLPSGTIPHARSVSSGDNVRVVYSSFDPGGSNELSSALVDVQTGAVQELWTRAGAAAVRFEVEPRPGGLIVLEGASQIQARSQTTGELLWARSMETDPQVNSDGIAFYDVNSDGKGDAIVSPTYSTSIRDEQDFPTRILALNGSDGSIMWDVTDPLTKYGARELAFGDVTNNGTPGPELLVGSMAEDGFPLVGQADEDAGAVVVYDPRTGRRECRVAVDRYPTGIEAHYDHSGGHIQVTTLSGSAFGFLGLCMNV